MATLVFSCDTVIPDDILPVYFLYAERVSPSYELQRFSFTHGRNEAKWVIPPDIITKVKITVVGVFQEHTVVGKSSVVLTIIPQTGNFKTGPGSGTEDTNDSSEPNSELPFEDDDDDDKDDNRLVIILLAAQLSLCACIMVTLVITTRIWNRKLTTATVEPTKPDDNNDGYLTPQLGVDLEAVQTQEQKVSSISGLYTQPQAISIPRMSGIYENTDRDDNYEVLHQ